MNWFIQTLEGLSKNQLFGGGLMLMLTGALMGLLRKTPMDLYHWVKRRVTIEVEVLNSDRLFDFMTLWLDSHPYSKKSRRLTATVSKSRNDDGPATQNNPDEAISVVLSPAPGNHLLSYKGKYIWMIRHRSDGSPSAMHSKLMREESYTLTMMGRNQVIVRELLSEIVHFASKPSDKIQLFVSRRDYWASGTFIVPRSLSSVVLPHGLTESIVEDVTRFLKNEDWYRQVGIPYHRGYQLHGIPGSGKTSLVMALAGNMHMNVYLLNVAGAGMDDDMLASLMDDVPQNSIVLMEDVDCTFPDRDKEKDSKGITLSGLLNVLDGARSREGCIVFMTTNKLESLDAALLRPGRVDLSIEFGYATVDQVMKMRERLNPSFDMARLLEFAQEKSMAEVQQFLVANIDRKAVEVAA